jgi:hypothetical protein
VTLAACPMQRSLASLQVQKRRGCTVNRNAVHFAATAKASGSEWLSMCMCIEQPPPAQAAALNYLHRTCNSSDKHISHTHPSPPTNTQHTQHTYMVSGRRQCTSQPARAPCLVCRVHLGAPVQQQLRQLCTPFQTLPMQQSLSNLQKQRGRDFYSYRCALCDCSATGEQQHR